MKKHIYIVLILLLSCSRGTWDGNKYRPIDEDFELKGKKSTDHKYLKYNFLYIESKPTFNSLGKKFRGTYKFYPDGRVLFNTLIDDNIEKVISNSTWEKAETIGYYVIEDSILNIEIFLPFSGGTYKKNYAQIHEGKLLFGRPFFSKFLIDEEFYLSLIKIDE